MKDKVKQIAKGAWTIGSRHFALKLLSFVFAIMLWSYVISTNTDITRTKTIGGLTGYVSGQSTIEGYGIALLTDPTELLRDITVQVSVPRSNYFQATADNVQVVLDVSSVRTAGTREVALRATTSYGKVVDIYPDSIPLTFETYDSRSIPVNVIPVGEQSDYWYNTQRVNPSQITIYGATSLVQSVSQAAVYADMTDRDSSFTTAHGYTLLDSSGSEVSQLMLTRSASSISVSMDVFPTKELRVSSAVEDVLLGQVASGYVIEDISISPETVIVAADQELLDAISVLYIEPIEIDAPTQSFTRRATISGLTDFKYVSSEQVYANVQIAEETASAWIEDVYLTFIGKGDELTLSWQRDSIAVHVTGPRSRVNALVDAGLTATVDLTGLGEGGYDVPINIDTSLYPDLEFELETETVHITLDPVSAD